MKAIHIRMSCKAMPPKIEKGYVLPTTHFLTNIKILEDQAVRRKPVANNKVFVTTIGQG